jgi:hypothetical protein
MAVVFFIFTAVITAAYPTTFFIVADQAGWFWWLIDP